MDYKFADDLENVIPEADLMETVEAVLSAEDRMFERDGNEVHFTVPSQYCNFHGAVTLQDGAPSVTFSFLMELKAPPHRRNDVMALLGMMNEAAWLGHLELGDEVAPSAWRFTMPLIGRANPAPAEIAAIMAAGLDLVQRFYPAFQYLVWSGKSPQEAAEAALFETSGQA